MPLGTTSRKLAAWRASEADRADFDRAEVRALLVEVFDDYDWIEDRMREYYEELADLEAFLRSRSHNGVANRLRTYLDALTVELLKRELITPAEVR